MATIMQTSVAEFDAVCGWCGEAIESGEDIALSELDDEWFHPECASEANKTPEQVVAEANAWLAANPDALLGEKVSWAILVESGAMPGSKVSLDRVAERLGASFENVRAVLQEISEPLND